MKNLLLIYGLFCLGFISCSQEASKATEKEVTERSSPQIVWDHSSMLQVAERGGYPRLLKLIDGSLFIAYENYQGDIVSKRSLDNGKTWSEESLIHSQFVYTAKDGLSTNVRISNPEICQLKNGDILVACNYRPVEAEVAPFSITILRSVDNAKTWQKPQVLYNAAPRFKDGCWEPSFLQLNDSELQIYFANENPYQESDEQEISVVSSFDAGKTWSKEPRTVSFRKDRRDGMPVATLVDDEIVVVIEDNKQGEFKPYTVRCKVADNWETPILADSPQREYCLAEKMPDNVYMGAPYILKLPQGELLISYQNNENRDANWELSTMEVAIGDKTGRNFSFRTQPFPISQDKEGKWNSLALINDTTVVALTSSNMNSAHVAPWIIMGHIKY